MNTMPNTVIQDNNTTISSLEELKLLYSEGKYEEVVLECERIFSLDATQKENKALARLYTRSKGKIEEKLMKNRFATMKQTVNLFKQSSAEVRSINEALYWINIFLKKKEYRKAIRGCHEILMIDPSNGQAKTLLEQARYLHMQEEEKLKRDMERRKQQQMDQEEEKYTELEKLKFEMTNALDLENFKKAAKLANKILILDSTDQDAINVKHQIERITTAKKNKDSDLHTVDLSGLKKLKRKLEIYRMKGGRLFFAMVKHVWGRLRETEEERLKRKALSLVAEKKDNNILAQKIQKNIIPQIDKYTLPGFDVWGDTIQSDKLGGDSFNFIQKDAENILFYIGDASGHGIRASLFASRINLILRECAKQGMGLRDTAITLNRQIIEAKDRDKDFMTMLLFNWDLKRKMLTFVGAGHEYILHYIQAERKLEMIPAKGIAIGMIEDVAPLMVERHIKLADQDMLILFTDGVTESVMKDGGTELFGMERLNKLILKYIGEKNSREMYRKIIKELGEVSTQRDDVTLLILRRDESGDMVFEEDLKGIESIDLTTLKNLSRAEVEKSLQEISLEQKIKRLLLELKNMIQRGEYQLIINKCTAAIKQDKIYNKEVNLYLKKAKRYMIKQRERERKEMINTIYKMAREDFKAGEFLRAKMGLLKIVKLDEQNLSIKYLFKKVEKSILRYGNRRPKKKSKVQEFLDHLVLKLNLALNPVNKKDNIDFIVKLSSLVNSGIKVKESLMILIKQAKKESLKEMYRKMIANLEKGFLLSFSMSNYPKVFPSLQVNLVRAGEESGNLGLILEDLSKQVVEERDLNRKIKGALIYPLFIVGFSILLVTGMLIFVVPQLASAYKDANLTLPMPTLIVIGISTFIQQYWYILLLIILVFSIFIASFKKTLPGMLFFDQLALKMPVIKDLTMKQNIFLFANSLSMLLDSGILLLDAMSIASDVVKNLYYKRDIIRMRNEVVNGKTLSVALGIEALTDKSKKANELFPIQVPQMVQVGETTGQITKMLRGVGQNYQEELRQFAKSFSTIIEPFLIVFIGLMVGMLLIAIMLPFFEFGKAIKNM